MNSFRAVSYHKQNASKTLNWFGSDTELSYQYNLKHKPKDMSMWVDRTIEYKFNEHGFRSEPFVEGNEILFLGASNTLGTGLPIENTWTYIVARKLNTSYYNLGQGGGSSDTMYRLASYWIEALRPKVVVYLVPPSARFEVVDGFDQQNFFRVSPTGVTSSNEKKEPAIESAIKPYFNVWSVCDENILLNEEKNRLAICNICNSLNTKIVCLSTDDDWIHQDYARDLQHSGIDSNNAFANLVLAKC